MDSEPPSSRYLWMTGIKWGTVDGRMAPVARRYQCGIPPQVTIQLLLRAVPQRQTFLSYDTNKPPACSHHQAHLDSANQRKFLSMSRPSDPGQALSADHISVVLLQHPFHSAPHH